MAYNAKEQMPFKVLEHTADIGIQAEGADFKEALAQIVVGMFSLLTELEKVAEKESLKLNVSAPDKEGLVVDLLNELIYLFEVERLLVKRCEVLNLDEKELGVRVYGERLDPQRHPLKMELKAATYHMLKIENGDGSLIQVLFDV